MTEKCLGEEGNERLAEVAADLTTKNVEIIGWCTVKGKIWKQYNVRGTYVGYTICMLQS